MTHLKLQILLLLLLIGNNIYIVNLIRKNRLELRHAFLWLSLGVVLILFVLIPDTWVTLAAFFGILEPVNMLFLFAILILFVFVFYLILYSSKQHRKTTAIAQEVAILKHSVEKLQHQIQNLQD